LSKNEQTEEKTIMKIEQLLSDIKKVSWMGISNS
jgi:hypothetical protein